MWTLSCKQLPPWSRLNGLFHKVGISGRSSQLMVLQGAAGALGWALERLRNPLTPRVHRKVG